MSALREEKASNIIFILLKPGNIVESGIKHHKTKPKQTNQMQGEYHWIYISGSEGEHLTK
jgi:hypothetical protein